MINLKCTLLCTNSWVSESYSLMSDAFVYEKPAVHAVLSASSLSLAHLYACLVFVLYKTVCRVYALMYLDEMNQKCEKNMYFHGRVQYV